MSNVLKKFLSLRAWAKFKMHSTTKKILQIWKQKQQREKERDRCESTGDSQWWNIIWCFQFFYQIKFEFFDHEEDQSFTPRANEKLLWILEIMDNLCYNLFDSTGYSESHDRKRLRRHQFSLKKGWSRIQNDKTACLK